MSRPRLALLVVALLGVLTLVLGLTSTTQVIHRRIHTLFDSATFASPLSASASRLRTLTLENLLADSITLNIPAAKLHSTYPRDEFLSGFAYFLQDTPSCQLDELRIVSLQINGPNATARVTFVSKFLSPPRGFPDGPHSATLSFNHASGAWRATSLSVDP
jgi:hypothetical protein